MQSATKMNPAPMRKPSREKESSLAPRGHSCQPPPSSEEGKEEDEEEATAEEEEEEAANFAISIRIISQFPFVM